VTQKWRRHAACADMPLEIFFPETGNYNEARRICERCPVRTDCLDMALSFADDEYGMFGGLTPKQRGQIRWEKMWTR